MKNRNIIHYFKYIPQGQNKPMSGKPPVNIDREAEESGQRHTSVSKLYGRADTGH